MSGAAFGLALALCAAGTTATAHALLKSGADRLATRFLIGATEAVIALPVVLLIPLPHADLWPWLLASAAVHGVYQLVLVKAYDATDFSLAFPLARGIAPLATALLGLMFLGDQVSLAGWLGIAAVTAGIALLTARRRIRLDGMLAAAMAGLLTTAYTLIDAQAVRMASSPIVFIAWFFLLDGLVLTPVAFALRGKGIVPAIALDWRKGVLAGLVTIVGFGAALWALALASAGAVSALRETSVVVAVIIGALCLGEHVDRRRVAGSIVIAGGAVAILFS